MDLSIIIVSYNCPNNLKTCIEKIIESQDHLEKEIIIIDNGSREETKKYLKTLGEKTVIIQNNQNQGFARAINQGIEKAMGEKILFLNPDSFIEKDTIKKTVKYMDENPQAGVVGVKSISEKNQPQKTSWKYPTAKKLFATRTGLHKKGWQGIDDTQDPNTTHEVDWVEGSYLLTYKRLLEKLGGLDPKFYLFYDDVDYCKRIKDNGNKIIYYADTQYTHLKNAFNKKQDKEEYDALAKQVKTQSELIYLRKHHGISQVILDLILTQNHYKIELLKNLIKLNPKSISQYMKQTHNLIQAALKTKMGKNNYY